MPTVFETKTSPEKKALIAYVSQQRRIKKGTLAPGEAILSDPRDTTTPLPSHKDAQTDRLQAKSASPARKRKHEDNGDNQLSSKKHKGNSQDHGPEDQEDRTPVSSPKSSSSTEQGSERQTYKGQVPTYRGTARPSQRSSPARRTPPGAQPADQRTMSGTNMPKRKSSSHSSITKANHRNHPGQAANTQHPIKEGRISKKKAQSTPTTKVTNDGSRHPLQARPSPNAKAAGATPSVQEWKRDENATENAVSKKWKADPRSGGDSIKPSVEKTKDTINPQPKNQAPTRLVPMKTAGVDNPRLHLTQHIHGRDEKGQFCIFMASSGTKMNPNGTFTSRRATYTLESRKPQFRARKVIVDKVTGQFITKEGPMRKQDSPINVREQENRPENQAKC